VISGGWGAPEAAASALRIRSIPVSTRLRTSSSKWSAQAERKKKRSAHASSVFGASEVG